MSTSEIIRRKAMEWLSDSFDKETKEQVRHMLDNDEKELTEAFYTDLEFGTGGLRGIMGAGTNRMNIYTVGMATQGFCNYINKNSPAEEIKVAVAHDSRNNSRLFAETTASIFSANGFKVLLFDDLRPTPELSFAIRQYNCIAGVVITASHNPKEYNGYKAYWSDGGQLVPPHDKNVIEEVKKIKSYSEVKTNAVQKNIILIGEETDKVYIDRIKELSLSPDVIERNKDMKIVYTPIHGTGVKLVPMSLKKFGFNNIITVDEQCIPDGNFPTVVSPNPEVPDALRMAIEKAEETNADLVLATDPDADRVGIAVRDNNGKFILLNGNQTGSILVWYLLTMWKEKGKLTGKEYVCKTIVTTELIKEIADANNVQCYDVLTGFKYIAELIKENEGVKTFIGGGEESYGYLAGEFVRDKDAVMSCSLIAEAAAWAKDNGKTMFDLLNDIYLKYGFFKEDLINVVKKGKEGAEEISSMMEKYRKNPPSKLNNSDVIEIRDYKLKIKKDLVTGQTTDIEMPASNVLQFFLRNGSKITVRPSGTEPKIKFYIGLKGRLETPGDFQRTNDLLASEISAIVKELGI